MNDSTDKITIIKGFISHTEKLLENINADCTGFYVNEPDFRSFKKEVNGFFNKYFPAGNELGVEFNEMVTEGKKHKMIYAKVLLQELLTQLENENNGLRV